MRHLSQRYVTCSFLRRGNTVSASAPTGAPWLPYLYQVRSLSLRSVPPAIQRGGTCLGARLNGGRRRNFRQSSLTALWYPYGVLFIHFTSSGQQRMHTVSFCTIVQHRKEARTSFCSAGFEDFVQSQDKGLRFCGSSVEWKRFGSILVVLFGLCVEVMNMSTLTVITYWAPFA